MRKFFTYSDCVVPVHHPRVQVETAIKQGAPRDAVLEGTDLTFAMLANPETRISYFQYACLTRNCLKLTGNPALGIDVGRNTDIPQMGVLALALMNSRTLGAALDVALRYGRLLAPAWELDLRVEGAVAIFRAQEAISLAPFQVFATEVTLGAFETQCRTLAGHGLPLRELRLAIPRMPHAERYRELFDAPISFDQPVTEAFFDAACLEEPVAFADPATAEIAERYCAEAIALQAPNDGLISQVRRLLDSARGQPPDLETLARRLQTSTRSLRRSLQEMGVSYLQLLDESRRVRAEEWVRSSNMDFEQIAERLGFSNVRSFRRAFKRWTACTPSEYREQNTGCTMERELHGDSGTVLDKSSAA